MNFNEILGNNKIKQDLQEIIDNNTISHSYMFVGIDGIGKKLIAKEFARKILCLNKQNQNCATCDSCIKFNSGNNPDFLEIFPDGNSIKIAQMREMQEKIYKKPIVSDKKVFIIDQVEKMTEEAQNSLLKTLEEPPEYMVIILITSNENKLLNTVKSRCIRINFTGLSKQDITKYAGAHQINIASQNLLEMCGGSIEKLEKINENIDDYNSLELATNKLIDGKLKNVVEEMNCFNILYESKEIIQDLLDYMTVLIYLHISKEKDYRQKFLNTIKLIEETKQRLNSNTNYDMSIDNLLFKIWEEFNENNSRS